MTELAKINLQPTLPPDIKAKRTIFIRQVDLTVGRHTPDEIKTEIKKLQPWAKIQEVVKIKEYTHVFKLICKDSDTTQRILTDGLKAFNTKINTNQMTLQTFTHLLICFKCYKYERHSTKDCPETIIKCSECAQTGHSFKDCTSTIKRCLNCPTSDNHHRTLAAKCPYRKKTIDDKNRHQKDKEMTEQNTTFAEIAKAAIKQTVPQQNTITPKITLSNKTHLKMVALILEAHIASLHDPPQYGQILSKSLKENFDIDATFPDRDSKKIFNFYYNKDNNDETDMDDDQYIDDNIRRS